jgi:hypothetical protein
VSTEPTPAAASGSPRYAVNRAIFDLTRSPNARSLLTDKQKFLAVYELSEDARRALLEPDWRRLLELGALPNLVYRYYMLHGFAPESFPAALRGTRDATT